MESFLSVPISDVSNVFISDFSSGYLTKRGDVIQLDAIDYGGHENLVRRVVNEIWGFDNPTNKIFRNDSFIAVVDEYYQMFCMALPARRLSESDNIVVNFFRDDNNYVHSRAFDLSCFNQGARDAFFHHL
jgi:hypothetical protein